MNRSYGIAIDLPNIGSLDFTREAMPNLAAAVTELADTALVLWRAYAAGAALPDGHMIRNRTGEYARSIMLRQTGDFAAEVYSDLPYANVIEEGAKARDLKDILGSSLKVRLTKDGRRYLIIPFRHNAPGAVMGNAMPQQVYDWWQHKSRARSRVTGTYERHSGTGAYDIKTRQPLMVPARRYVWGSRLGKSDLEGMGVTGASAKRMEGMVNFRSDGRRKGSGGRHGQYLTFRVMVENSRGWLMPAQPGRFTARSVSEQVGRDAEARFSEAVALDLAAALGGEVTP